MDNIVDQLTEIEEAANAIVSHAISSKEQYEDDIKTKQKIFDDEILAKTNQEMKRIEEKLEKEKTEKVENLQQASKKKIAAFVREYEENHEAYAASILKRIIEVRL